MHLSKSRLKKKGSKPQMSAGRGRRPRERQALVPVFPGIAPKNCCWPFTQALATRAFLLASRPQCKSLVSPCPPALTTVSGPCLTVLFSPYPGGTMKGAQGGTSVTLSPSELPVAGATEQFGLPTVQKGAGVQSVGALLCPLPQSVQLASAHLA